MPWRNCLVTLGSTLTEELTKMGSEGHHLQKLNEPRVQNISHLKTPFISGALQLQRLLGLRTQVSDGKVGRRCKIQAHLIVSQALRTTSSCKMGASANSHKGPEEPTSNAA